MLYSRATGAGSPHCFAVNATGGLPMREHHCAREDELLDALQTSRWPETCEAALRDHVASCEACTDLLAVAAPLLDGHRALMRDATVPSSAIVWWRAQVRSRREAAEKAERPISVVFGIAVACAAGLLATALGIYVPTVRKALPWLAERVNTPALSAVSTDPLASPIGTAAVAALLLCVLVGPIVLYVTLRED